MQECMSITVLLENHLGDVSYGNRRDVVVFVTEHFFCVSQKFALLPEMSSELFGLSFFSLRMTQIDCRQCE